MVTDNVLVLDPFTVGLSGHALLLFVKEALYVFPIVS